MARWTVKTYYKKNVEEIEKWRQLNGEGRVTVENGFRWGDRKSTRLNSSH